jgi:hypothetical protein
LEITNKLAEWEGPRVCYAHWNGDIKNHITFYHCPGAHSGRQIFTRYTISFSVDLTSLHYWKERLKTTCIQFSMSSDAFLSQPVLLLKDPDGLPLKLVFTTGDKRRGLEQSPISSAFAIKGFYGVEISSHDHQSLAALFTRKFWWKVQKHDSCKRFLLSKEEHNFIDVGSCHDRIQSGEEEGLIHHIAIAMKGLESYTRIFSYISRTRYWSVFRWHQDGVLSLYFRMPEGILFELLLCPIVSLNKSPLHHMLTAPNRLKKGELKQY